MRTRRAVGAMAMCLVGCGGAGGLRPADPTPAASPSPAAAGAFREVAEESGIVFEHRHGGKGDKNFIETMGGGVVLFDPDRDGDLDAYLVQSGPVPGDPPPAGVDVRSRLFRNDGAGRFTDVTDEAGVANLGSYGQGAVSADYDEDGWPDLYVTNFGPNRLYHNEGEGRFRDVTSEAGVGDPLWSVSGAFGDLDGDGLLDLYVANYVDFTMDNNKWCGRKAEGVRAYCHPDQYNGVPPRFYRNRGDGTFEDRTGPAGLLSTKGKGLGVVMSDFDLDGDLDIFGANDSTINYVWRNRGDATFDDLSLASGGGYNEDGKVQACMGIDAGDYDGDGRFDVFVTNLDLEYNTLYRNEGEFSFADVSYRAGVAEPLLQEVGFGTELFDFDLDGWLDIFVANGHVIDNIRTMGDALRYEQPKALLRNRGDGRFEEVSAGQKDLEALRVSRGAAFGDLDGDGDIEVLVGNNNQRADLYRNDGLGRGGFLVVRTEGRASNRDGVGARLTIEAGGRRQVEEVRAGSSYASSSDPAVTFGLGRAAEVSGMEVRWPSGLVQRFGPIPARSFVVATEGEPALRVGRARFDLAGYSVGGASATASASPSTTRQ